MKDKNEISRLSRIIDGLFNIKKPAFYLILIFFLGFVLRIIAAVNLGVYADDAVHSLRPINFIGAGKLETYDQSSGLWYAFTNVIYSLFGINNFTSRIAALIFGSLSIILIFLLSQNFFNEKVSLISAFLFAISPFLVRSTIAEMDVMAMFFVLFGMLIFIKAVRTQGKNRYFCLSGILIGLALYTKVYPLFFIPSLLLYYSYVKRKEKKKIFTKQNIKGISIFLLFAFIFAIPALTHNYLLYKDKGFLDLQFTRTLGVGKNISEQYYGWDHQFNAKNDWKGLILGNSTNYGGQTPTLFIAIDYVRVGDPVVFYFGILGILMILFKRKEYQSYLVIFFLNLLFILPLLASIILLPKHFIFLSIFTIPLAAFSLNNLSENIYRLIKKHPDKYILIFIFIFSLIWLAMSKGGQPILYGKSHIAQVIDFKEENIPPGSLIITDSRIYRGRLNWMLYEKQYIEGAEFIEFLGIQENIDGEVVPLDIFYLECVKDDCGWGGGKISSELNSTMEQLTELFKQNGVLIKEIYEQNPKSPYSISSNKEKVIRIYKSRLNLKEQILVLANSPKRMHINSIGYVPASSQFDNYSTQGFLDFFLNKLSHWIVLLSVILAFISIISIIYLYKKLVF